MDNKIVYQGRYSKKKINSEGLIEVKCPNPECNKTLMAVKADIINTRCKQCKMWIELRKEE